MIKKIVSTVLATGMAVITFFMFGCAKDVPTEPEPESVIKSVSAIGFVDVDGAKLKGIAVEYEEDLTGATVSADMFTVKTYAPPANNFLYKGNGSVGDILKIYVNDEADLSETGGSGTGHYVVMEMFCDYVLNMEVPYVSAMTVRVSQKKDIVCGDGTVIEKDGVTVSNLESAKPVNLVIDDVSGFKWYTNKPGVYGADGPAYHLDHCFNQQDGLYYDEDLSYALFVPEDWHKGGNYAMVTLQNPAAADGTHPLEAVLTSRSPAMYASEWAQELVKKEHGVDGMIVVVPVITERVNDNGGTPAEYEAVVHLWDDLIEQYDVNPDYVYGSGQSVGGMILLETNRLRDNFFAGLLLYEDQWAQNYYPETIFVRNMVGTPAVGNNAPMHYSRTDGYMTWDYSLDTNGEKVYENHDPYNMYYLISDDNIMIMSRTDNNLSMDAWTELKYLYSDLAGYDLQALKINAADEVSKQNSALKTYTARSNALNINWVTIENGSNGYSCRRVDASYEWLLSQSRQDEIQREKLDLNKPFVLNATQQKTEARKLRFTDADGNAIYFLTGASGSGTQFYNSCWLNTGVVADAAPGWLPGNLNWNTGVSAANVKGVTAIGNNAVAIEYDTDMSNAVIHFKDDEIIGLNGQPRTDIKYVLNAYDFYDASGNVVTYTAKTYYVNTGAATKSGAARGSGSGNYIIVEFEQPVSSTITGVVQRTTVITDKVIASASHIVRKYD